MRGKGVRQEVAEADRRVGGVVEGGREDVGLWRGHGR